MADRIGELMTKNPIALPAVASAADAARAMRDNDVGTVLVTNGGQLCGIVTDRDLVVRALALSQNPGAVRLRDICSRELATLPPDVAVDDTARLMREKAVRRVPLVENGGAVGIVSLADLALDQDRRSALADISAAPPNH